MKIFPGVWGIPSYPVLYASCDNCMFLLLVAYRETKRTYL